MSNLYSMFEYLAGRCDGARSKDDSGFNGYDAGFGKRLALTPESAWTDKDKYNAWNMLRKYSKQLAAGGYDYNALPELSNGFARSDKLIGVLASGEFVVVFPYNPALVAEVKALPQRRFDGDGKRWVVAPVAANIPALWTFIQAHPEFEVTQTILDKMAEIDAASEPAPAQPEQPKFDGVLSLDDKKVVVTFNAIPDQTTRDWMKKIPGWKFDGATKQWSFPVGAALVIAQKFTNHDGAAMILEDASRDAAETVKVVDETKVKLHAAIDVNAPLPNGRTLYQHQKEGVLRMLDTHKIVLADDMGLGKTLVSLMVAKAWKKAFDYPTLVICPASLKDNWFKEAAMVQTPIEVYSWAKMPEVLDRPFVLICDEAHYSQAGTRSARGKAFLALASSENCKALIAATGTPMKNGRPVNMWPLLRAVGADFAMDKKGYERRYCAAGPTRFSAWDTSGAAHLDELHEKCKPFMLRRLKKDCLDLPGKVRTMRPAELSKEAQTAYDQAFNKMREDYLNRLKVADENKKAITARYLAAEIDAEEYNELLDAEMSHEGEQLVMLTHLRRAMSIAKAETGIEMAEDVLGEGRAVVIFTDFVESAQQIAKALKDYGVELLTGDVTGKDAESGVSKRQAMVDRFQAGKSRVFVSTIKAGGVGITLTAASDVILIDRPWVPGDAEQAEDRCFVAGTPVLTPNGWVAIEDVKIGDYVITRSGNPAKVIDAWSKSARKMMVDVEVMGNGIISCTADHKWLTFDGRWVEAGDLRPGSLLSLPGVGVDDYKRLDSLEFPEECRISNTFVNSWGKEQRNGRLIKAPSEITLDNESLFVFGYFVGDGFASNTSGKGRFVSFAGNNGKKVESLERCERWCADRGLTVNKQIDGNRVEYRAYCGEWANWFKLNFGHFAENKRLPEWALSLSREQSMAFLDGMLSSDGYKRKNQAEYCTCSYTLAGNVALLMMRAGYRPTIRNVVKEEINYNCWIVGFTYGQEQFAKVRTVKFRNPEKTNDRYEDVYDITVEGEQSFVVSTMVVHNCNRIGQSVMVNCQWIQAGDIDVKIDGILVQKQERIDAVMEGTRKTMRATGGSITGQAMGMLFEMFDNKQSKGKK